VSSRRLYTLAFALLAVAVGLHAWRYWPFVTEQTLISLRYAERFANGHGLTFSDGEPVEGYSNFLFIVLSAVAQRFGADALASARFLGFIGVLLAIACVGLEPRRRGVFLPRLVVGGVLLVATVPVAIAAVAGVEQGLVAGLVALSLRLLERSAFATDERRPWLAGIPLALLALVRADGVLLALGLVAGAACLPAPSQASLRRAALQAIPAAVAFAAHLVFRIVYYGDWLPASARQTEPSRVSSGLELAGNGYASAGMLVLLAIVATVLTVRRGERFRLVMPGAVVVVSTVCVVLGGGDPAPGYHALVPSLTALCFVAADEVGDDWLRVASQRVLVLPILALCAFLHLTQGSETQDSRRARDDRSLSQAAAVGRTLSKAFKTKRPLLAVENPGALAVAADVDVLDLSGRHGLAPEDAADLLRSAPDLVALGSGPGSAAAQSELGRKLVRARRFLEGYQWISVDGTPRDRAAIGDIWVRRERGKLGIVRTRDRIDVPGYFFTGQASPASSVIERGVLVAELSQRAPGVLPDLDVPAGRFRLEFSPRDAEPVVDLRCHDVSMQRDTSPSDIVFEADGRTPISIVAAPSPSSRSSRLRLVRLTRVADAPAPFHCVTRGRPLVVAAALVAQPKSSRNLWTHPSHLSFAGEGLVVEVDERSAIGGVEVSLSDNEAYRLELRQGRHVVWAMSVEARRNAKRPALVTHRYTLPKRLEGGAGYDLFIKPRKSAAPSTLGHATFF
jgi:arabinofuranosyltransferase